MCRRRRKREALQGAGKIASELGVRTYARSSGVAGVDPLRLCAKVAPPPSCLEAFGMPPEPMGTLPPKAQPALLFTGIAAHLHQHHCRKKNNVQHTQIVSGFVSLPSFPFGNLLAPALPVCCACWPAPNPFGIPLTGWGKLPENTIPISLCSLDRLGLTSAMGKGTGQREVHTDLFSGRWQACSSVSIDPYRH